MFLSEAFENFKNVHEKMATGKRGGDESVYALTPFFGC